MPIGSGVGVERGVPDLSEPVELGFDEPRGAGADVALDAGDPRVRRILVGGELGLHDGVAGLAAELDGLHLFDREEGGGAEDDGVERGQDDDDRRDATHLGIVEIEFGKGGELLFGGALLHQAFRAVATFRSEFRSDRGRR